MDHPRLGDAAADLVLGGRCVGCRTPGRVLCPPCHAGLTTLTGAAHAWPVPLLGPTPVLAAARYDGVVREAVNGHKERALHALRPVLAALLAAAVEAALAPVRDDGAPVVLVPVPSRPGTVTRRGHDPTRVVVEAAARLLGRAVGTPVAATPLLRSARGVRDQAGLGAAERWHNLAGSMRCPGSGLRRLARRHDAVHLVVCDDVVTTGSTAHEARRALAAVGLRTLAVAAVAATPAPSRGAQRPDAGHTGSSQTPPVPPRPRTD